MGIVDILVEIDPSTLLLGGGAAALALRIFAVKKIRRYTLEIFLHWVPLLFGYAKYRHILFKNEKVKLFKIKETRLATPLKTALFRTILETKISTVTKHANTWVNDKKSKLTKIDKIDLLKSMKSIVKHVVSGKPNSDILGYETLILRQFVERYGVEKGGAYYKFVYTDRFKPRHEKNIKPVYDFFDEFFESDKMSNDELIDEFLSNLDFALKQAIRDMKDVFNDVNGDLEGL